MFFLTVVSGCSFLNSQDKSSQSSTGSSTVETVTPQVENIRQQALDYNDAIIAIHSQVVDTYNIYINSLASWAQNIQTIESNLAKTIQAVESAIKKVNLLTDFRGDNTFVAGTKTYFDWVVDILKNEETQFVSLLAQGDSLTWSDAQKYISLEQSIQTKLETIDEAYKKIQEAFAKTYNFVLQTDEVNPEFSKTAENQ